MVTTRKPSKSQLKDRLRYFEKFELRYLTDVMGNEMSEEDILSEIERLKLEIKSY